MIPEICVKNISSIIIYYGTMMGRKFLRTSLKIKDNMHINPLKKKGLKKVILSLPHY